MLSGLSEPDRELFFKKCHALRESVATPLARNLLKNIKADDEIENISDESILQEATNFAEQLISRMKAISPDDQGATAKFEDVARKFQLRSLSVSQSNAFIKMAKTLDPLRDFMKDHALKADITMGEMKVASVDAVYTTAVVTLYRSAKEAFGELEATLSEESKAVVKGLLHETMLVMAAVSATQCIERGSSKEARSFESDRLQSISVQLKEMPLAIQNALQTLATQEE